MLPIAACNISQQAHNFIDDKISTEQTGGRVSVRPVRLDLQRGRHPFIDQAFGRSHLSGMPDGHERVAWHIGPDLQTEIAIHLWFEMSQATSGPPRRQQLARSAHLRQSRGNRNLLCSASQIR
jgi:hypothetical protein